MMPDSKMRGRGRMTVEDFDQEWCVISAICVLLIVGTVLYFTFLGV